MRKLNGNKSKNPKRTEADNQSRDFHYDLKDRFKKIHQIIPKPGFKGRKGKTDKKIDFIYQISYLFVFKVEGGG